MQLRSTFSRITYSGALSAKIHTHFGGINTQTANMDSESTTCIHFSNFSLGRPPDPHLREEDTPSRPSPCGASRRFSYAPSRQWTLWIRHCSHAYFCRPLCISISRPWKQEPKGALIAHLSTMSTSVKKIDF